MLPSVSALLFSIIERVKLFADYFNNPDCPDIDISELKIKRVISMPAQYSVSVED